MTEYVCKEFGGPNSYHGKKLSDVHKNPRRRGQGPKQFDQVMLFVEDILTDLNVPEREFHEAMAIQKTPRLLFK